MKLKEEIEKWKELCKEYKVDPEKWAGNTFHDSYDFNTEYYILGPPKPTEKCSLSELCLQRYNGVFGEKKLSLWKKIKRFFSEAIHAYNAD